MSGVCMRSGCEKDLPDLRSVHLCANPDPLLPVFLIMKEEYVNKRLAASGRETDGDTGRSGWAGARVLPAPSAAAADAAGLSFCECVCFVFPASLLSSSVRLILFRALHFDSFIASPGQKGRGLMSACHHSRPSRSIVVHFLIGCVLQSMPVCPSLLLVPAFLLSAA